MSKKKSEVKVPAPRQLSSGKWFIQLRLGGQSIPITENTEREAIAKARAIKSGIIEYKKVPMADRTLGQAVDLWLEENEARLSPATVRGYMACRKNGFKSLMNMRCGNITPKIAAQAVNQECRIYAAKTVVNRWRFLAQVLEWATGERYDPSLPQVVVKPPEFLDEYELDIFLRHIRGRRVEIVALLALSSLRRSEIAALNWDEGDIDLKNRWIHVRGAMVPDKENHFVTKETNKNSTSRRDVPIIDPLYDALTAVKNKHGRVVPQHPDGMLKRINCACRQAGVPEVGCHGLRHSFASLCQVIGVPPHVAMEIGGWSDRATMDRIYTHVSKRTKDSYKNQFTAYFANKNANDQ